MGQPDPSRSGLATPPARALVHSAGTVVTRKGGLVLLVHRPAYDDWSFPKGKLERGEHPEVAAVRETLEETGLRVRLGRRLADQRYEILTRSTERDKLVNYWTAQVTGRHRVRGYTFGTEIDEVGWFDHDTAVEKLTYDFDRDTLAEAFGLPRRTHALVVLRHAKARSRKRWRGDDQQRPLRWDGAEQARRLVPILSAYGVTRVVSSASRRCVDTVAPFTQSCRVRLRTTEDLTEEEASPGEIEWHLGRLLNRNEDTVVCGHRPVLPEMFKALGVDPVHLEPSGFVVIHHRHGKVLSVDEHPRAVWRG